MNPINLDEKLAQFSSHWDPHVVADYNANDVMVVEPSADSIDDRQRLIPWVSEQFILEIDRPNRRILVDWDPDF